MSLFDTKDNKYVEDYNVEPKPETPAYTYPTHNENVMPSEVETKLEPTYEPAPVAPTYKAPYDPAPIARPTMSAAKPVAEAPEVAFISSSTKIDGNITTQGHLVVNGTLYGQASAQGNVVLNGEVTGDVNCDSVVCETAKVTSNIVAKNNVVVKNGTVVVGDITCNNITVYGQIKGNITATGSVVMKSSASVEGNITAARIGIESGTKLSGTVTVA